MTIFYEKAHTVCRTVSVQCFFPFLDKSFSFKSKGGEGSAEDLHIINTIFVKKHQTYLLYKQQLSHNLTVRLRKSKKTQHLCFRYADKNNIAIIDEIKLWAIFSDQMKGKYRATKKDEATATRHLLFF